MSNITNTNVWIFSFVIAVFLVIGLVFAGICIGEMKSGEGVGPLKPEPIEIRHGDYLRETEIDGVSYIWGYNIGITAKEVKPENKE